MGSQKMGMKPALLFTPLVLSVFLLSFLLFRTDFDPRELPNTFFPPKKSPPRTVTVRPHVHPPDPALGRDQDLSLPEFALAHHGPPSPDTLIWLTQADGDYLSGDQRGATNHLKAFLERLDEGDLGDETKPKHNPLIILCLDESCAEICMSRGWPFYSGYSQRLPEKVRGAMLSESGQGEKLRAGNDKKLGWIKLTALIELGQAGYTTVFTDGDVFFNSNPFPHMLPLTDDSYDLMIQDEHAGRYVNIGFFVSKGNPTMVKFWTSVLEKMMATWVWDQLVVNDILQSQKLRAPDETQENRYPKERFVSPAPENVRVAVLESDKFIVFHRFFGVFQHSVFVHMTCANQHEKTYISAVQGYGQDVFGYYTSPPKILTLSHLSGTDAQLERIMKLLISFALASNRAILLPRQGIYVASNGSLYPRNIWTLYPIGEVESRFGVKILEPNYVEHASSFLLPNSPEVARELVSDVKELRVVVEVDDTPDLGMTSFWSLLDELVTQPYRDAKVVRLIWGPREDTLDKWRGWNEIPSTMDRGEVRVCKHIEVYPGCEGWCSLE